ncbi:MerR family transcriptional regulator [bacterium]|nr:MerR family transcriptional regulator [bacterium]
MSGKTRKTEYLTRGELLKLTNLSPRQIQYWDETGLVSPARKTKRRRYYDFANLVELRVVESLLREGFSTQKVRDFVRSLRRMLPKDRSVLSRLRIHTDGRTIILQEKGAYFEMNGQGLLKLDLQKLYHQVSLRTDASSRPMGTRERGARGVQRLKASA